MTDFRGDGITLVDAVYFTTDKRWIYPAQAEETYELIFVTDGEIYIEEEGRKKELSCGELLILRPGIAHKGYKYSEGITSFYRVNLRIKSTWEPPMIIKEFSGGGLFSELLYYFRLPGAGGAVIEGILMHLLGLIIEEGRPRQTRRLKLCNEIIGWISDNADATLSVKAVAVHFGYNSEYLTRLIKGYYNVGIKTLINECIIKKAKDYLVKTDYSVKEIAEILKFSDSGLFSNFYKYHTNELPSKCRSRRG